MAIDSIALFVLFGQVFVAVSDLRFSVLVKIFLEDKLCIHTNSDLRPLLFAWC